MKAMNGMLGVAAVSGLLLGFARPGQRLNDVQQNAEIAKQRMARLTQALRSYETDHGQLPSDPALLYPTYVSDAADFFHPGDTDPIPVTIDNSIPNAPNSARVSFEWSLEPGVRGHAAPDRIVVRDNSASNNAGQYVMLMAYYRLLQTTPALQGPSASAEEIVESHLGRLRSAIAVFHNDMGDPPANLGVLWEQGLIESPLTFWNPGDAQLAPTDITNNAVDGLNSTQISFTYSAAAADVGSCDESDAVLIDNSAANNGGAFRWWFAPGTSIQQTPYQGPRPSHGWAAAHQVSGLVQAMHIYSNDNEEYFPIRLGAMYGSNACAHSFWSPGDSDPRPTVIDNATPDAPNSALISYRYAFEGQRVRWWEIDPETVVLEDNSPANNRGLGIYRATVDGNWWFEPVCEGDFTGDRAATLDDLLLVLGHFGTVDVANPWDGDSDGDLDVDIEDLMHVLENFGTTCL